MRREIRFRGRSAESKKWEYGSLVEIGEARYIVNKDTGEKTLVDSDSVGEYVEIIDAYEGDSLYGSESDCYGGVDGSWIGVIRFNTEYGRLMVHEERSEDWYEVDDYDFEQVVSLDGIGTNEEVEKEWIEDGILIVRENTSN